MKKYILPALMAMGLLVGGYAFACDGGSGCNCEPTCECNPCDCK